jgi:mannose-6-phosphate isomerase
MIEIMEPTDFAVRIEFERGGYVLPVESHYMNQGIDFALSMFNYEPISVEHIKERFFCKPHVLETHQRSTEYVLIDEHNTPCFSVNRIDVRDSFVKASKTFYIGIVTKGSGTIAIGDKTYPVSEGTKFFVPYQTGPVTIKSESGMEIIATFPPE